MPPKRNYWLIKSEPSTWSWDDHWKKKNRTEPWDGVRNHTAKQNLMAMKIGDLAFFYHSVKEKRIVGICEVVKEHYPDPSDKTGKFCMVDFKAIAPMPEPVTLADIKTKKSLADIPLIKQSRLSVQPVPAAAWKAICKLGKYDPK